VDGLSARWRSATAEAAAAPALQMAAKVSAQISAQAAAHSGAAGSARAPAPSLLSRVPRRAVWSALAALVGAAIVFYLLALRLLEDETRAVLAGRPGTKAATAPVAAAPGPTPSAAGGSAAASAILAKALEGEPVAIAEDAAGLTITLHNEHQFAAGSTLPGAELRPLIRKIAAALDQTPGPILVVGHADVSPTHSAHFASNAELSAARARSVAQLMAPKLRDAKRLSVAGRGDAEPVVPNDTEANRAKNRRVVVLLKPAP
jgi:type VI secretion system protein ImpK